MIVQDLKSRNVYMGIQGTKVSDSANTTPSLLDEQLYILYGIQRLNIQWSHEIGMKQGLTANFLQPWYNKPVEIEIQGESYIGMFGGQTIASILANQQANAHKSALDQAIQTTQNTIAKAMKVVGNIVQPVLNSFSTLSKDLLNMSPNLFCANTGVTIAELDDFFSTSDDLDGTSYHIQFFLDRYGKTAHELREYLNKNSPGWIKNNVPASQWTKGGIDLSSISSAAGKVTGFVAKYTVNPIGSVLQKALQKNLELLKLSLGPKEDKTVYNLKRLISYYRSGPVSFLGSKYKNLAHVLLIENDQGMGDAQSIDGSLSGQSSFSTFIGYIKDFSYTESTENPFIYDYNVRFVGLPDTADILGQAKNNAKIDGGRGGVNVTVNPTKDILSQGLGLLTTIKVPSIPSLPGLK